eukprot:9481351-Pyramimonas_sp.AAC.1
MLFKLPKLSDVQTEGVHVTTRMYTRDTGAEGLRGGGPQVGVPMHVAMHMTYPEKVSRYNIEKLRKCVMNGMTQHPGANFVVFPDGNKWFLKFGDRRK